MIDAPYLLFLGDEPDPRYLKTAQGLAHWSADRCLGQIRLAGASASVGLPDLTVAEAAAQGAKTLIVGVAAIGGGWKPTWIPVLLEALAHGLNVAGGLHTRLNDHPELAAAAAKHGRRLIDVRTPPKDLPVGSGKKRTGKRLLTVGTDCAAGKKFTALALHRDLVGRGVDATFRATGQTGILIAGAGIPIDSVVCDFTSGAAEVLSPDAAPDHWDVIEGQGSLYHPGYAGVSLGLLHGSQPDAIVLCHDATRATISGFPDYALPSIEDCISRNLEAARLTNPNVVCVGVAVNTSVLSDKNRDAYLEEVANLTGLPATDPVSLGVAAVADRLLEECR